jgi:hypothetical protein
MAWTVSPTADAEGNVSGFETNHAHEGYWKGSARDYVEDPVTNEISHVMQGVELNEDYQDPEYTTEGYFETLASLHPNISQAVAWAASGGMSPEWAESFNASLDHGDLEAVNAGLEQLLGMYDQSHGDRPSASEEFNRNREEDSSDEDSETLTYQDLSDSDREQVDNVIEELQYSTPQGEEYGSQWHEVAEQYQAAGDTTAAIVAEVTSQYHQGLLSADEAISFVLERCDIREAARAYQMFTQG